MLLLLLVPLFLSGSACGGAGEPGAETTPTPQASPTEQPSPTEAEGRLAFVAGSGNAWDIYVLDVKEGQLTQLTEGLLGQWPRWSPDGQRLAFLSLPLEEGLLSDKGELVVISADGAERETVAATGKTEIYSPVLEWSPDGRKIAWESAARSDGVPAGINTVDVDSGQIVELAPGHPGAMPAWSPDGSLIAFVSYDKDPADSDIYIMEADGSNVRRLAETDGDDIGPRWSPDGRRIIWWLRKEQGARPDLLIAEVEDGKAKHLGSGSRPAWSSDGRRIAFMDLAEENNVDIFVLDLDSGERINVTSNPARDMWPTWSPDGVRIAFVSQRDAPQGDIYLANADGSNMQRLTENDFTEVMLSWSAR
jgi:Tol biopolymer transport system component